MERFSAFRARALLFLGVIGPGIIAGTADNDAGGITTYSVMGASFGYRMLWLLLVMGVILGLTQEMGARLGLVTGKGLAALIREHFSLRITALVVLLTFMANFGSTLSNFAGVASVADLYHVPRFVAVPLAGLLIWVIVRKGSFRFVQKIFLTSSLLFLAYVFAGFLAHPDWPASFKGLTVPLFEFTPAFFATAVAVIGTTITAWGQFFVQSYVVDKGVAAEHLPYSRADVFFGSFWTVFIAFFIVVATAATLHRAGITVDDAGKAVSALEPFAGVFAKHLFAWGFLNASLLGIAIISMTASYVVTEAFGWEGRVDLKAESPVFYRVFAFCLISAGLVVLIPGLSLVPLMLGAQMVNTFVLPVIFVAILILLNKPALMGVHKNGLVSNILGSFAVAFVLLMSFLLLLITLHAL